MSIKQIPDLDQVVIAALDFFINNRPKKINLKGDDQPFVIGSGNAYNTAKIIFSKLPAVLATESNFRTKLKTYKNIIKSGAIKRAIIISASGEKDAPQEISEAKKYGLQTILLTCDPKSTAAKLADKTIIYNKIPEPITYNVSTYLGIILSISNEKAAVIKNFIKDLKLPKNFSDYKAYSFILPDDYAAISPMLDIKKHELFGAHLSLRSFTYGEARHAKFVSPWEKELVISLGENEYFGSSDSKLKITMPKKYGAGLVMALTYYLIGLIQKANTPYFRKNVEKYCIEGPKAYGKNNHFQLIS